MSRHRFWSRPLVQDTAVVSLTAIFWLTSLFGALRQYGLAALSILLSMLVWVEWNLRHYGRHNKRTKLPVAVLPEEMALQAGLSMPELMFVQAARLSIVDFDNDDHLRITDISPPETARAPCGALADAELRTDSITVRKAQKM